MARIVIVEDDLPIAQLVRDHLRRASHDVSMFHAGDQAMAWLAANPVDLVLLDVMLPGRSGLEVCRHIRAVMPEPPIVIMLTARKSEDDAVIGYDAGADDYVRKPFGVVELMARIDALLRLAQRKAQVVPRPICFGALRVDPVARRVSVGGREVALTHLEFDMLLHFMRRPGVVITREQLLAEVWGYQAVAGYGRTVDSHVTRVRKKLRACGLSVLATVHAAGYRFEPPEAP